MRATDIDSLSFAVLIMSSAPLRLVGRLDSGGACFAKTFEAACFFPASSTLFAAVLTILILRGYDAKNDGCQ